MKIINIYELDKIEDYLKDRNLLNQYIKAKNFILLGDSKVVGLKLREPKKHGINNYLSFRGFSREIFLS